LGHVPLIDLGQPPPIFFFQAQGLDLFVAQVLDSFGPPGAAASLCNKLRNFGSFAMISQKFVEKSCNQPEKITLRPL
jgi:hypothetical protein